MPGGTQHIRFAYPRLSACIRVRFCQRNEAISTPAWMLRETGLEKRQPLAHRPDVLRE